MAQADDPRLAEAKALPIAAVVEMLALPNLKRAGHELVGPCPHCGGDDRFGVNLRKGLWQCRICGAKGDAIALVMWDRGLDFRAALTWLCGEATALPPEEVARRRAKAEETRRKAEAYAAKERARTQAEAKKIWEEGRRAAGTAVEAYLARRGLVLPPGAMPACLRFHPDLPFTDRKPDGSGWRTLHRGPAMLAAVQQPDGQARAVHRTWIDLDQPKGKAVILHPETGAALPSKKVLGSKKGGTIRLTGRLQSAVLVVGEGIESTLSPLVAGAVPGAAFWAGVDLGNIAGRRQSGPGLKYAGYPDMSDDEAFVPPPWVRRMVLLQDGDSDPRTTRAMLEAGARRAKLLRPGLEVSIARAREGMDVNDMLNGGGDE